MSTSSHGPWVSLGPSLLALLLGLCPALSQVFPPHPAFNDFSNAIPYGWSPYSDYGSRARPGRSNQAYDSGPGNSNFVNHPVPNPQYEPPAGAGRAGSDPDPAVLNDGSEEVSASGNMGELPPEEMAESGPGWIEWCEGDVRKRVMDTDCKELTFVPPFPACYCVEGIASIRLDHTKNCQTGLHWAKSGCYNFESLGHGVRSIRLEQNFRRKDFVIAVERTNVTGSTWEYYTEENTPDGSEINVQRNLRVLNGELFQHEDGWNCVQKLNSEVVRVYKNVYGKYNVSHDRCPGFAIGDSRLVLESPVVGQGFQLCTPSCTLYSSNNTVPPKMAAEERKDPFCRPIPIMLKSLHDDLNTRILQRSIERAFKPDHELYIVKPEKSFKILSKLSDITHKVCGAGGITTRFLDAAVDLFQVSHEGRGFYFHETFIPKEFKFIMDALHSCLNDAEPIKFQQTECEGTITRFFNGTKYVPVKRSIDHQYFDHHIVLDLVWNMVDLANVVCVDSFHHSYRMYHEMEQGMEKLFTRELRSFWMYPDFPRNFYERLFGIFWEQEAQNLELCVESAYLESSKRMWRLNRPTWVEGTGGRTTEDKVCKRRITNEPEKILSSNFEAYCNPLACE